MIKKIFFSGLFYRFIFFPVLSGLFFLACNEDFSDVGLDLLHSDTLTVGDTTIYVDAFTVGPVRTIDTSKTTFSAGVYTDPVFGKTSAGFMLELLTDSSGYHEFKDGITVDSVYLGLRIEDFIGDTAYFPQLQVYRLTTWLENMDYFSDTDPSGMYDPQNLTVSETYRPDTGSYLEVRLSPEFGRKLMNPELGSDSLNLRYFMNDYTFDSVFNGLYVTTTTEGAILDFSDLLVTVYFRTATDTGYHTFSYYHNQLVDKNISLFQHDYSNTEIEGLNDTLSPDSLIWLQSMGGTQGILKFRGLESLRSGLGNVIINRAELVLPFDFDSADLVYYPAHLGLKPVDEYDYIPEDMVISNSRNLMGGSLGEGYRFFLTRYFNDYFKNKVNNTEFRLFTGYLDANITKTDFNSRSYSRIIIKNDPNNNKRIALKLVYTYL